MATKTLKIDLPDKRSGYPIAIGNGSLDECGARVSKLLRTGSGRIVIVSNPVVFKLYGKPVFQSLARHGFTVEHCLVKDGEKYKSFDSLESILKSFAGAGLSRTDIVVALGGGVIGDMAGFAAAIYLRGISFLQVPTTLLSMIDSSVGGKTGVNTSFGKNLTGAFHQPVGVLIDTATLSTLPVRELTAGFCEAIKQGAIGGKRLLKKTGDFLSTYPPADFVSFRGDSKFESKLTDLIVAQIEFKAAIVAGDPRESSARLDPRSRKILNFGHTLAHALEKVTDYKYLKHGEAVGYGILFAAEISNSLALIDRKDVKLLNDVVHRAGVLPRLANIDPHEIIEAFRFDKKHLSGRLEFVLLKGIGKPVIVTERDIPQHTIKKVLTGLLRKWS